KAVHLGNINQAGEPLGDSAVSQDVTIPATAADPTLSFWFWGQSSDIVLFDQQYVRVTPLNPPGPTVELMSVADNSQVYQQRTFSLAGFVGQTVRITFGVHQDGFGDATGMFVDDVSIAFATCGPPDFRVVVTPPAFDEVCAGN